MWNIGGVYFLVIQIIICGVSSRAVETMNSSEKEITREPVDIPIKIGPITGSPKNFSIFNQVDDPLFDFMTRMANFGYLSSQVVLNRMKNHSEKTKEIGGQIEDFIESIPSFPIPVLDDISHRKALN